MPNPSTIESRVVEALRSIGVEDHIPAIVRIAENEKRLERQRCLKALPPERIIHSYSASENTPENRAWNEYREAAIGAISNPN